jgi:hypothetical protein
VTEGTSANHLEATAAVMQQAGDLLLNLSHAALPIDDHTKKLGAIVTSAIDLARTFCFESAAKPSSWSEDRLLKRRHFCQQALEFARHSLSMMEETLKSQKEKGFGVGGARGEKRGLEEEEYWWR